MPWTAAELGYLAGLIDGEGSISVFPSFGTSKGKKYPRLRLVISIYNTDRRCLDWVEHRFGGRVSPVKRARAYWKQSYVWCTGWQNAKRVLEATAPYMIIKQEQANLFIECANGHMKYGSPGVPEQVQERRLAIVSKMKQLNARGTKDAVAA